MSATFKLMALPLDPAKPAASPTSFDVRVISNLEFPEGTATSADIQAAVSAHPVLAYRPGQSISALAVEYSHWLGTGKPVSVATGIPITLTYAGSKPLAILQETLASYLARPADVDVTALRHDRRFDDLQEQHFLDVIGLHDDLSFVRAALYARATEHVGFSPFAEGKFFEDPSSYDKARWLNGYVQATILDSVFGDPAALRSLSVDPEINFAIKRLKSAMTQVEQRMDTMSSATTLPSGLRTTTTDGDRPAHVNDPNVAIHAALKNSLLSEECGLVTRWEANSAQPIVGDYVFFFQAMSFGTSGSISATLHSTAFRRIDYTHPLSFADITSAGQAPRTTNAGLARLNEDLGEQRYRATAVNAEAAIFQGTVLQLRNSLSNTEPPIPPNTEFKGDRDDRPPQLLADEHHGFSEPECSGLTISAPIADLLTHPALGDPQRASTWPCLFLEDFWIGYRLDLSDDRNSPFLSVHQQTQEIKFTTSLRKVSGASEDFFAKEQPAEPLTTNSTEIIRYIGMSSSQAGDYLKFLGIDKSVPRIDGIPFEVVVTGYSDATALLFGRVYSYRLRNVFIGGISFSQTEADAVSDGADRYVQSCPFLRARAYKPGEIISPTFGDDDSAGRSIFLTSQAAHTSVWLVPTPLDIDTARYHGLFLSRGSEPKQNAHRAFVQDVQKHFHGHPTNLQYFFDPEVSEVVVRITMLNGDPESVERGFAYQNGSYCELAQHLHLSPVRVRYGQDGKWQAFKPIELRLSSTSDSLPSAVKNGRIVHIWVPPAADLEISILPMIGEAHLTRTAIYAASSTQFRMRTRSRLAKLMPVPAIAEQKLRVIHCTKTPATKPLAAGRSVQPVQGGSVVLIAQRERFKETAELSGYLQVDAASTGQVRLEAAWSDIDDDPRRDRYALTAGRTTTAPRSVSFARYSQPSGSSTARAAIAGFAMPHKMVAAPDAFDLQCAENKVFLGPLPDQVAPQAGRACILDFGDGRRKQATVTAVATARYKRHFGTAPAAGFETRSENMLVEVPASMRLPVPDISHVIPLSREVEQRTPGTVRKGRSYAMRVYVRRPWFVSGPGERLAIGCRAGNAPESPQSSLDKFITQWGEDPLERPHLDVTRRSPRASDFAAVEHGASMALDDALYPERSIEGTSDVLYRDNLLTNDTGSVERRLSVASFALRPDLSTNLWFCDLTVTEGFLGWCGLALYRHQPHSHEETQLCSTPAWVYGAILHGEQVAWFIRQGKLQMTVGPVFDPNISYELHSFEYRDGVSINLATRAGRRVILKEYLANGRKFFETIVQVGDGRWSLVKRRFGSEVASIAIKADSGS